MPHNIEIEEVVLASIPPERAQLVTEAVSVVARAQLHPGRATRAVSAAWEAMTLVELRGLRATLADQATTLQALIAGIGRGTVDTDGRSLDHLKADMDRLGVQLAALRKLIKQRQQAPAERDAGKALGTMADDELLAYADELDEDIRDLKVDVADVQQLRALAIGELGRRKLTWRAKH